MPEMIGVLSAEPRPGRFVVHQQKGFGPQPFLNDGRQENESPPPSVDRDYPPDLPTSIWDPMRKRNYKFGGYLGKGGFAWCYEAVDMEDGMVYAMKVIPKHRLTKTHHRQKVLREIRIHERLNHRHVVKLLSSFEDAQNIYITLEYCRLKSLVNVMRKRGTLTEPEVRYYIRQLLLSVHYLVYQEKILHRDIKLGNMLISGSDMQVKLADFGLATDQDHNGTSGVISVCGTPNYIAPEVLMKKGHSVASEMWAVGCTIYAMLTGKPPFETSTLDETYRAIASCRYSIPIFVSSEAQDLIIRCLHTQPDMRPQPLEVLDHPFFREGICPYVLSEEFCDRRPLNFELTEMSPNVYRRDFRRRDSNDQNGHQQHQQHPYSVQYFGMIPNQSKPDFQTQQYRIQQPVCAQKCYAAPPAGSFPPHPPPEYTRSAPPPPFRRVAPATPNPVAPLADTERISSPESATPPRISRVQSEHNRECQSQSPALPAAVAHYSSSQSPPLPAAIAHYSSSPPPPGSPTSSRSNDSGLGAGALKDQRKSDSGAVDKRAGVTEQRGLKSQRIVFSLASEYYQALTGLLSPHGRTQGGTTISDPVQLGIPVLFVAKWIDYTNKYGFGCQLSDGTICISFLDGSKLCTNYDGSIYQYVQSGTLGQIGIERMDSGFGEGSGNCESPLIWFSDDEPPEELREKTETLDVFHQYMHENLMRGCDAVGATNGEVLMPYLVHWTRLENALLMVLSDGTFQVNFFQTHVKVIMKRDKRSAERIELTYVDESRHSRTYILSCGGAGRTSAASWAPGAANLPLVKRLRDTLAGVRLVLMQELAQYTNSGKNGGNSNWDSEVQVVATKC